MDGGPELKLWTNGKFEYRDLVEPACRFTGTWGVHDSWFYFSVRRLASPGHGFEQGHTYSWEIDAVDDNQLVFRDAAAKWLYVRKGVRR